MKQQSYVGLVQVRNGVAYPRYSATFGVRVSDRWRKVVEKILTRREDGKNHQ